ncbi:uncharacterized protein LOC135477701 [Liolophura sinensis]|uniref:uncharacterized protein LOC135477701 n=1 Tax=Liolophura sinensis TaxID=3198878 RepID=UPI003158FF7D
MKLAKWQSLTRHIRNIHTHPSEKYPECRHGPLEDNQRNWMEEGSRPYKLLCSVVTSPFLMKDIEKLSPFHQTYGLEVYHNIVNHFAPKSTHFFFQSMLARLYLAGLHYNENSRKPRDTTSDGRVRWQLCYPKAKKGLEAVVKPISTGPSFGYVDLLIHNLVQRRKDLPSYQVASEALSSYLSVPAPTTSGFVPVDKACLIERHKSRFSKTTNSNDV